MTFPAQVLLERPTMDEMHMIEESTHRTIKYTRGRGVGSERVWREFQPGPVNERSPRGADSSHAGTRADRVETHSGICADTYAVSERQQPSFRAIGGRIGVALVFAATGAGPSALQ